MSMGYLNSVILDTEGKIVRCTYHTPAKVLY